MAAWAEVRQLQEELYNVQLQTAKNKLSERNCIAVIQRLISLGLLEVIYSCDGKEYITPKQLQKDILDELYVCGGRVSMTDLAQSLNVDYTHIDRKVNDLLVQDSNLSIHYGELISKQFFDNLAVEINETLQETGLIPLTQLSQEVSLPVSTLSKELIPRVGELIIGTYDKKNDILFTAAFVERQASKLRGACSAATRPVQLDKIMDAHEITSSLGYKCVKDLISTGRLQGQLQGTSSNPVFIPLLYTSAQNQWADCFYNQNGYITLQMMQNKGISNPQSVMSRFENSIMLTTCCISESTLASAQSVIEDVITSDSFIELNDWMFEWCNEADETKLLEFVLNNVKPEKYTILSNKVIISTNLLSLLLNSFNEMINEQAKLDAVDPKILSTLKKFDDATANLSEAKHARRGKGGKKGKKNRGQEENDEEEYNAPKSVVGPTFLTIGGIADKMMSFSFFIQNEPKEDTTLSDISEFIKKQLDEKYKIALDEELRKKTFKSSKAQQKADEETINNLYNTICLCERSLKLFEDSIKAQIQKHIARSLCQELLNATFIILGEEYECPFQGDNFKLETIIPYLPKNAKPFATAVLASISSGSSIVEFLENYENLTDPQFTQLLVKKLDKKKERNMIFSQKQNLLEQLKTETKSPDLLNIACSLLFIKHHSTLLHVPGRCISAVVQTIAEELTESQKSIIESALNSVVKELKGEHTMSNEEKDLLRNLVTDVLFGKQTNTDE